MRLRALAALLAMAAGAMPALAQEAPIQPRLSCEALAGMDLSAELGVPARVDAAAVQAESRPAPVCHLRGTIRGTIGFEAWLPTERWTGRYLQIGCGGLCGRVSTAPPQVHGCVPYEHGEFAVAATDMGHRDPSAASWGGDGERRLDFAHRAQHLTARGEAAPRKLLRAGAAPLLLRRLLGRRAGGTAGSRPLPGGFRRHRGRRAGAGLDGAEHLPPRLDGAAEPARRRRGRAHRRPAAGAAPAGAGGLRGGPDGVVSDPLRCSFDPLRAVCAPGADPATCLTEDEARAAAAIYDGPRTAAGERLTAGGLLPGSEANWRGTVAPEDAKTPPRALLFSTGVLRHLAFPPGAAGTPAPQELAFDAATLARLADSRRVFDATATDLGPFFARGGRLLVWHGLADQDITPRTTLVWWHALRRDQGAARVDASARLFLVPGLAHCRGGAGSLTELDTLTPLLRWVEKGVAPDNLAGGRVPPTGDVAPEPFLGAERFSPRN